MTLTRAVKQLGTTDLFLVAKDGVNTSLLSQNISEMNYLKKQKYI